MPTNAREGNNFDASARCDLITSMRASGNTVPMRLRRDSDRGPSLLCFSDS